MIAWCARAGWGFILSFFTGLMLIAHFVPPVAPALGPEAVADIYRHDGVEIRLGLAVCMLGSLLMLAFGAALADQIRRIHGVPPVLVLLQVGSFASAVLIIDLPLVCWGAAGLRAAQRSPEVTQALNDLGWLCFVGGVAPYIAWTLSTGAAVLLDHSEHPVLPRWSGYLSVFVGLAQVPGAFVALFVTGPLAWNGVFAWWVPLATFFVWTSCMTGLTDQAVTRRATTRAQPDRSGTTRSSDHPSWWT